VTSFPFAALPYLFASARPTLALERLSDLATHIIGAFIVIVGATPERARSHAAPAGGWMERLFFGLGAISAGLAVALGAFAAHGPRSRISAEALARGWSILAGARRWPPVA